MAAISPKVSSVTSSIFTTKANQIAATSAIVKASIVPTADISPVINSLKVIPTVHKSQQMPNGNGPDGFFPRHNPPEAFDTFFSRGAVRASWIAFFIMFILWAFLWIMNMMLEPENPRRSGTFSDRSVKRAHKVARDLLLGMLAALVINSFGRGTAIPGLILFWLYLGLAVIWLGSELMGGNKIVRIAMAPLESLILLVIFILSYAVGWRYVSSA
ncbi:7305_t:CDS:2 [Ambispora gerdemannii]|uniref:7305_t:CDS:1 n=1 Tax=Ambispora gerdemannii TaxID=144530 RepID=A0A9N9DQA6_9GLOM|nr:7305_t:CDS:2 [Ambispora gerdemannii]